MWVIYLEGSNDDEVVKSPHCCHCEERFMRRGNLELVDLLNYEIAEFVPSHKTRLLRLRLAMTARDLSPRRLKDFFNNLVKGFFSAPRRKK
jgi:hypothetical protein